MEFDIANWVNEKKTDNVLLEHVGDFTSDYIDSVLPSIEAQFDDKIASDNIRKKVFHIFVECIQNLFHHIEPISCLTSVFGSDRIGAILLVKDEAGYRISTGNFIKKEKEKFLQNKIDQLNTLSADEIKRLYRETINNSTFSAKGGAGIGMIDMARKTGNKLHYQFYPVKGNADILFYSFDVLIN
ncbi:MAG: SiaB family protein kinase [Bacteroidales bacterium]|nr:SiaB family protein kinase [Bacteroidales bacterium]